jgi:hypothetical protein
MALHTHICGACEKDWQHTGGSHLCPNCGEGPWHSIYDKKVMSKRAFLLGQAAYEKLAHGTQDEVDALIEKFEELYEIEQSREDV